MAHPQVADGEDRFLIVG